MLDGKRIFVLEDDANNLAVINSILRRNHATVFYDTWGTATLDKLQKYLPINLIILDLMLPSGVSGYDIFEQIKAEEALKDIPVIVITAADPDIEVRKAREKGFSGFLSKPVRSKTLPLALKAIIEGQPVWEEIE